MEPFTTLTGDRRAAAGGECRYRQDHPGAVPQDDQAHRARACTCSTRCATTPDGSENGRISCSTGSPTGGAQILIAHENFGCGSSREHAPWALLDFGIRCVIAPDFADIFHNNCFKNGILPVRLPRAVCDQLMADAALGGNARLTIDLERQVVVRPNGEEMRFEIDPFRKHLLLNGLDDIGQTLQHAPRRSTASRRSAAGAQARGSGNPPIAIWIRLAAGGSARCPPTRSSSFFPATASAPR